MKTFFIYLLLFVSIHSFAQETELPEIIESAFTTKYPNANLDDWKSENGTYFLNFYLKSEFYTSIFDKDGKWIETAEIISDFDLPLSLREYLKKNYPSEIITYCEKVEKSKAKPVFRVNIAGDSELTLQSNEDGSNIKIIEHQTE